MKNFEEIQKIVERVKFLDQKRKECEKLIQKLSSEECEELCIKFSMNKKEQKADVSDAAYLENIGMNWIYQPLVSNKAVDKPKDVFDFFTDEVMSINILNFIHKGIVHEIEINMSSLALNGIKL